MVTGGDGRITVRRLRTRRHRCEDSDVAAPVFYLGVGAQKAGTTWLWSYLSSYPSVDFGRFKEYHVWDGLFLAECRDFLITSRRQILFRRRGLPGVNRGQLLRYRMQHRVGVYENYFRSLICGGIQATGDITPVYAGLSARHFAHIRTRLEDVGFQVRPLFVMRDPFERCWSAVRMQKRDGMVCGSDEEVMRARYSSRPYVMRADYQRTITELEQVFAPHEIFYGIYEELHTPGGIAALDEFCGLAPEAPSWPGRNSSRDSSQWGQRINASPKSEHIPDSLRAEVIDHYSQVYEFCNERFPQTKILWPGSP